MGVLDELREAMRDKEDDCGGCYRADISDFMPVIDTFETAHPGLVDRTVHCANCGVPFSAELPPHHSVVDMLFSAQEMDAHLNDDAWWDDYGDLARLDLCPTCAKEATE